MSEVKRHPPQYCTQAASRRASEYGPKTRKTHARHLSRRRHRCGEGPCFQTYDRGTAGGTIRAPWRVRLRKRFSARPRACARRHSVDDRDDCPARLPFWLRPQPARRPSRRNRSTFGRLRGVGAKNFIFERRPVKTLDDGLHFVRCRSLDERESLRFLRFVIPDHLDRIRDKVFSRQPLFNVIGGDPRGQIAQKNGKTH